MPSHRHLRRLSVVWEKHPVYFVTICVHRRRPLLAIPSVHAILKTEWLHLADHHGWAIGRYVVLPDHVHFFAAPMRESAKPLATTIGRWKEWTSKRMVREIGITPPVWQPEFFDHLLRSGESRSEKWNYVKANPVRAGLVSDSDAWPFAGAIHFD
ncbi:MAG: transposase [Verrucomicrobia bacterium]|nr:transposase [Verrucomicrobiota bacterium]